MRHIKYSILAAIITIFKPFMTFFNRIISEFNVDTGRNTITVYALGLLAFGLPFPIYLLPYLIALVVVSVFLQTNILIKVSGTLRNWYFWLLAGFYLIHLLGMLYTSHLHEGWFLLQVKLSLILIPLVVFIARSAVVTHYHFILRCFMAGNILSALICILYAVYRYLFIDIQEVPINQMITGNGMGNIATESVNIFTYNQLSFLIHVNYYALFVLFVLYLIYQDILKQVSRMGRPKWHQLVTGGLLLIFFFLLQSRSAVIAALILMLYESVRHLRRPGFRLIKIGLLVVGVAVVIGAALAGRMRVLHGEGDGFPSYSELKDREIRLILWERAWPVVKKHPILGVGTGDDQEEFKKTFDAELLEKSSGHFYNVHNEYIQTAVRLGIPSSLLLVFILMVPLRMKEAYLRYRFVSAFILITGIAFVFESMLNRIQGVVFFSLFYSLFSLLLDSKQNAGSDS